MIYDQASRHLQNFMPNDSRGVDCIGSNYYPIRNPRWQPPMHFHTFITETCIYQLPMILTDFNLKDIMSEVIKNINNVSFLGFKKTVKTFFLVIGLYMWYSKLLCLWIDILACSCADEC